MLKLKTTKSNRFPLNYARAQRDHIQKTFNKYQISLTHNIMPTTYRMPCPSKGNIPTRRGISFHIPFYHGVFTFKTGMLVCPVLFILLKGKGTSYLVGGISICCPLTLYIPTTFHIPLSPRPTPSSFILKISISKLFIVRWVVIKPFYQARESSLVPLCLHPVHFMLKT